jgi:putative ABC transport system permease protein
VPNPQELVQLGMQLPGSTGAPGESFSYAIVRALAERTDIFAGAAGFSGYSFNVGSGDSLSAVPGALVTGAYYETLDLRPAAGRLLARSDDEPGAPLAAVISDGYWERQFLRNPAAIGQAIAINGVPVTIAGVSPPGFVGANVGSIADITMAVAALPRVAPESAILLGPGNFWLRVLARPAPGVSVSQAAARLNTVWPQLSDSVISAAWPAARRRSFAAARFQLDRGGTGWTPLRDAYRQPLSVLMGVVAVVLLIACANVASLMMARASARHREIAMRLALGAGRGRIVRQVLIESTLLSLIGGAAGIVLAWASGRVLLAVISTRARTVALDLTPNGHVLAFTSLVAVATGVAFGLAPALQAVAAGPSLALKDDARTSGSRSRWLSSLIGAQVALSLVLLVAAGLFVRTLRNLQAFDPGFNAKGVLIVDVQGRRTAVPQDMVDEIQHLPGVASASLSTHTPLSGAVWSDIAVPRGQELPERDTAYFVGAGPHFFETMQTPLLSGRAFTERDSAAAPPVAIVNEAYARRYFGGRSPVGQMLSTSVRGVRRDVEIVGLARDTRAAGLRVAPPPTVYVSYRQLTGDFPTTLEVRATGSIGSVASALRRALQPRLKDSPVEVVPLSAQVDARLVQERLMATLAGAFGVLALLLACVGLYGLLVYSVARRTKEIGIRMALGAQQLRVLGSVLTGAVRLVFIGIAVGLPIAWAGSRAVRSMLFGLNAVDPATIGGAILLLTAAALVAASVPAWRASRVNPMEALRHE